MEYTNQELYQKLDEIHTLLLEIKEEEEEVIAEEHKIVMEEEKLMELLGKKVNKEFDNISDWKRYVWENCEHKKSLVNQDKIDFVCKKTKKSCRFIDCFKNKLD